MPESREVFLAYLPVSSSFLAGMRPQFVIAARPIVVDSIDDAIGRIASAVETLTSKKWFDLHRLATRQTSLPSQLSVCAVDKAGDSCDYIHVGAILGTTYHASSPSKPEFSQEVRDEVKRAFRDILAEGDFVYSFTPKDIGEIRQIVAGAITDERLNPLTFQAKSEVRKIAREEITDLAMKQAKAAGLIPVLP